MDHGSQVSQTLQFAIDLVPGARVCDEEEKESIELSIQLCKRIAVPAGWIKLTFIG